jgi:hypothetical protein
MKRLLLAFIVIINSFLSGYGQGVNDKYNLTEKIYIHWGWNRAWYTNSDIHFKSDNYDFTLSKVQAKDRQSEFSFKKYLFLTQLSVPQTNLNVGYHLSDKYSIAIGFDHMKYVMVQGQASTIKGNISVENSSYSGTYNNEPIVLDRDFLTYQHTDGLNYLFGEINRHDRFVSRKRVQVSTVTGASIAVLRPRSDVTLLNIHGPNKYHYAGYGINAKVGLNILLFNRISFMTEVKGGVINLPNVKATLNPNERVRQHFGYLQANVLMGVLFGFH